MEAGRVNLYSFIMLLPLTLLYALPYVIFWGIGSLYSGLAYFLLYFIPLVIAGIFLHELLHGIGWGFFTKSGIRSVRFGFSLKYLAPWCHCKEPLKVKHYRIGAALPLLMLGVIPGFLGILTGKAGLTVFGIIFSWAAGGDIISLFMLRSLDSNSYVFDHRDKMGFYTKIIDKQV